MSSRVWFLIGFTVLFGCAQNATQGEVDVSQDAGGPVVGPRAELGPVGTDDGLDVMTWNLEQFPKRGATTVQAVADVLLALKPDVVGVQEITDGYALMDVADAMPGWEADVAAFFDPSGKYNPPVGVLYDTSTIEVRDRYLILEDDYQAFPRSPLVLDVTWRGVPVVIITVHLKALGDDNINWANPNDEEVRRARACERLEQYIYEHLDDRRVVVVGDFNDRLEEPPETNVFWEFFAWPGSYLFADMPTAVRPTRDTYSYPKSSSHIDHILITNELFPAYFRGASFTRTVAVDLAMMDDWYSYESTLSDHRPVLMHLDMGLGDR